MPIARLLFAVLLLAMAAGQSLSFGEFEAAIDSYRTGAPPRVLAMVLLAGEVAAGVGLLAPRRYLRPASGWIGLAVAALWAALAVQAFARGLAIPNCGCFGRFLTQRLSWLVLLQDAYFVALSWLALRSARNDSPSRPG